MSAPTRTANLARGGVVLQPFTAEFVTDEYVGWLNDGELLRFSEQRHSHHDRASCTAFMQRFDHVSSHFWAISLVSGGYVGTATAYRDLPNATADIGMLVGAGQGRGVGTTAWNAIVDWLFATGIRKVTAGTMSSNIAMLRVFEKSGMAIEGVLRAQYLVDGEEIDCVLAARFCDVGVPPVGSVG